MALFWSSLYSFIFEAWSNRAKNNESMLITPTTKLFYPFRTSSPLQLELKSSKGREAFDCRFALDAHPILTQSCNKGFIHSPQLYFTIPFPSYVWFPERFSSKEKQNWKQFEFHYSKRTQAPEKVQTPLPTPAANSEEGSVSVFLKLGYFLLVISKASMKNQTSRTQMLVLLTLALPAAGLTALPEATGRSLGQKSL